MVEQKEVTSTKKSEWEKSGYCWLPDLPDHWDKMYGVARKVPAKLPLSVGLRPMCSKIKGWCR